MALTPPAWAAETLPYYYDHAAEADGNGVIAPWYKGQNGQYDYRVRIAAETLKRYPWTLKGKAIMSAPEYVFNGHWSIDQEGKITYIEEGNTAIDPVGATEACSRSAHKAGQ